MTIVLSIVVFIVMLRMLSGIIKNKKEDKTIQNGYRGFNKSYKFMLAIVILISPFLVYFIVRDVFLADEFVYSIFIKDFSHVVLAFFVLTNYPYCHYIDDKGVSTKSLVNIFDTKLSYDSFSSYEIIKHKKVKIYFNHKNSQKFNYKLYIKPENENQVRKILDKRIKNKSK